MRPILFIDRDGTLIHEPQGNDFRIRSLQQLQLLPNVIPVLQQLLIRNFYDLVLVTNQDGLGTPFYPENDFFPIHQHLMDTLKNAGICFVEQCIDRSYAHEQLPTRKPFTGRVQHYANNPDFDYKNSFVIGDSPADVGLAANLGIGAIWLWHPYNANTELPPKWQQAVVLRPKSWDEIANF
ncbi:MAG: histidinol-phosphatase [Sphingobacteriales bacterium]|nr:histidinol-phosphatase [Sphingobacteriales bacterium]